MPTQMTKWQRPRNMRADASDPIGTMGLNAPSPIVVYMR